MTTIQKVYYDAINNKLVIVQNIGQETQGPEPAKEAVTVKVNVKDMPYKAIPWNERNWIQKIKSIIIP